MPSFSIPADFQISTVEKLRDKNEKWEIPVKEVYGSLNPSPFGSGRKTSEIKSIGFDKLKQYVQFCRINGIEFNYTLNFNCNSNMEFTRKGRDEIIKFARKLNSIGIQRFTAVLPSIIEILNEFVPEAKVSVSVISNVDSLARLKTFLSTKNVDRIMVPEYLNRKTALLRKLTSYKKQFAVEFGTIVNSICLVDCPFRDFHYSFGSHAVCDEKYLSGDYYIARCHLIMLEEPAEILKMPWIRPEDIREYARLGIDWFKISGREMRNADLIKVVDIYNEGSFDGNLMELLMCFSDPTFSRTSIMPNKDLGKFTQRFLEEKCNCTTKDCETCNYCNLNSNLVHIDNNDYWTNYWKGIFRKDYSALLER